MTDIAGCIMHENLKCVVRALVFARRKEIRIGINETGIGPLDHVMLTIEEAKAFRRALSRAIREAEMYEQARDALEKTKEENATNATV